MTLYSVKIPHWEDRSKKADFRVSAEDKTQALLMVQAGGGKKADPHIRLLERSKVCLDWKSAEVEEI